MDLLNMLTGAMTSSSSVQALSGKTGTSSSLTSTLISAALPMLLNSLTNNASSTEGAQSLLGALGQHTSTSSMAEQLENADAEDGSAIIQHILGQNTGSVVQSLSDQTGASQDQVSSLLSNMAPAMMSGLSAATTSASNSTADDGFDFSDLLGTFGGSDASSSSASSLLGGLFGGSSSDASAFNGSSLLGSLTSLMK